MKIRTCVMTCGLALCLLVQPVMAGQFEDATAAYKRGDYATAFGLWQPLAGQNDYRAQTILGFMYENGEGVAQDYAEAIKLYRLAAIQGTAAAQFSLGLMYEYGRGVPQDYVQAHMWFNLAAAGFNASEKKERDNSSRARDSVAEKMTPDQIAEAQRLAREWLAAHPKP